MNSDYAQPTPMETTAQSEAPATLEQILAAYLASNREGCPACSYELYSLRSLRCPECGEALRLHLALRTPNDAAFYTGLCGLAAGLGFWLLLLCVRTHLALQFRGSGVRPDHDLLIVSAAASVSFLALLLAWIRAGRWLRRKRGRTRWTLATACIAIPIASVIALSIVYT